MRKQKINKFDHFKETYLQKRYHKVKRQVINWEEMFAQMLTFQNV